MWELLHGCKQQREDTDPDVGHRCVYKVTDPSSLRDPFISVRCSLLISDPCNAALRCQLTSAIRLHLTIRLLGKEDVCCHRFVSQGPCPSGSCPDDLHSSTTAARRTAAISACVPP